MAPIRDGSGHVYYALNPNVKFFMRNGRYYWTIKSKGFDSLEEAISDADGFVMTDLTQDQMERMIGVRHSDGFGKLGYSVSEGSEDKL